MKAHRYSLVLALAVALAAPSAIAQPQAAVDVRTQLPDAAKHAWDAAKQLANAADYRGALVEFQRAYELSHNPRVLFNLGVTEKLLTHYARAVDAWDKEPRRAARAEERHHDRSAIRHDDRSVGERRGRHALCRRLRDRQDALHGPRP